eukprot:15184306-Alexandrium_andersonii.AAC.1
MSASLVGSEMCIRDSMNCAGRLGGSPARCVGGVARGWARWGAGAGGGGAVSYTHLTLPTICSV